MSVVSLVGVHKSYGTWPVLQGVDFMVPDGARIGIIGPNGAGKSTMLRIVGGTEDVNEGEVVRRRGVTVSYLEQNPEGDDRTAEAWVLAGRPDIAALDDELRRSRPSSRGPRSRPTSRRWIASSSNSRRCSIAGWKPVDLGWRGKRGACSSASASTITT